MRWRSLALVVVAVTVVASSGCLSSEPLIRVSDQNLSVGERASIFSVEDVETRDTVSITDEQLIPTDPPPIRSGPETQLVLVQLSITGFSQDKNLVPDRNDALQIRHGDATRTPISVLTIANTSRASIDGVDAPERVLNLSETNDIDTTGWLVFEAPASWERVQITLDIPTVDEEAGPDASWRVDLADVAASERMAT